MPIKPLLSASSLSFAYGENSILENISFDIHEKDFIALIGPNGSGKTTLIKLLLGLLTPNKGNIKRTISKEHMGYVPQHHLIDKNFPGTVKEILTPIHKEIIKQIDIENLLTKKFVNLSGGQQQRVLIALALQNNPKLLILDEPTAGVDVEAEKAFYELLKKLNKKGIAIILITHEMGSLTSLTKRILCLNHKTCCVEQSKALPKLLKQMYGHEIIQEHHPGGKK